MPAVLEAKRWGTQIWLGTTVGDAACRSVLLAVLLLFRCYTVINRASAINNQQCCWLSMSIGSSGGTAVKSAPLVAAALGLAVLAVLLDGMVPGVVCPGLRVLGWSCVLRSFVIF